MSDAPVGLARRAGLFYLLIIVTGIFAEVGVRARLFVAGDTAATAANVLASRGLFRAGLVADVVMIASDVVVAVLLFVLMRPVGRTTSLLAASFRFAQAAVLAFNLVLYHGALLVLDRPAYAESLEPGQVYALSHLFLDVHAYGYDLALVLFAVHCFLLGGLVLRSGFLPRLLGYLMVASAFVYLIGSGVRFLAPAALGAVQALYVVPFVSELAFGLWLAIRGVDGAAWERRAGGGGAAPAPRPPELG